LNVQNIPKKDKVVKGVFVPKRDAFLYFDYKQIEYRLLAFYVNNATGDDLMCQVFREGEDLHAASAKALLGKDEITDLERDVGKTFNFLTIYGGGPKKASVSLGISLAQARELQAKFHKAWPSIRLLHNTPWRNGGFPSGQGPGAIQRQLKNKGYIETLWGRQLRPHSPHVALNALIQGCAADLMRWAFVQATHTLHELDAKSRIVNVVHDELMLDVVASEIPDLVAQLPERMKFDKIHSVVPVEVDTEISYETWAEKGPLNSYDGQQDYLGLTGASA
jgi:DNA polymerase-1